MPHHAPPITDDRPAGVNDVYVLLPPYGQAAPIAESVPTLSVGDLDIRSGMPVINYTFHPDEDDFLYRFPTPGDQGNDDDSSSLQTGDGSARDGAGEAEPEPDGVAFGLDTFTILIEPAGSDADFNAPPEEGPIDPGGTDSTVGSEPIVDTLNLDDVTALESKGYDLSLMWNSLTHFGDSVGIFAEAGQAEITGSIYAGDTIGTEDIVGDGFDVATGSAEDADDPLTIIVIGDGGQDPGYDVGSEGEDFVPIIEPIGVDTTTDPDTPDLHDTTTDPDANITFYTSNFGATVEPEQPTFSWTDTSHITLVETGFGPGSDPLDGAFATDLDFVPASVRGFGQSGTSAQVDLSNDEADQTDATGNTGPNTPLDLGDILDLASPIDELSGLLEGLGGSAVEPPADTGLTSLDEDMNDDALDGTANAVSSLGLLVPIHINGGLDPVDPGTQVDVFP